MPTSSPPDPGSLSRLPAEGDPAASEPPTGNGPPPAVVDAASWTWRVLLLGLGAVALLLVAKRMYLITLPFAAGILLTALAHPVVSFLVQRRAPRVLAVLSAGMGLILLVGGVLTWVVWQTVTQGPELVSSARDGISELPIGNDELDALRDEVTDVLSDRAGDLAGPAISGVVTVGEFVSGIILTIFIGVYLLYRGDQVWSWAVSLFPRRQARMLASMGPGMWSALSGWIRGTAIIAVLHGVVIGTALAIMGVPLAAPLGVLVFIGSFIPIIGSFLFGGFAVLVTFAAQGWVDALILIGILVVVNQAESHLLQPLLIGRYVQLNALAVVLALTAGALLWGVAGAILAVPLTAAIHAGLEARRDLDGPGPVRADGEDVRPSGPRPRA